MGDKEDSVECCDAGGGDTGGDRLAAVFDQEETEDFVAEPSSLFNR